MSQAVESHRVSLCERIVLCRRATETCKRLKKLVVFCVALQVPHERLSFPIAVAYRKESLRAKWEKWPQTGHDDEMGKAKQPRTGTGKTQGTGKSGTGLLALNSINMNICRVQIQMYLAAVPGLATLVGLPPDAACLGATLTSTTTTTTTVTVVSSVTSADATIE